MKIRSRTPWGYRVLGLVALSGMSLAVEAEEKIVLLTFLVRPGGAGRLLSGAGDGDLQKIWPGGRHSLRRPPG